MSDVIRFPQFIKSRSQSVSALNEAQVAADDVKMSDIYGRLEGSTAEEEGDASDTNISFLQQSSPLAAPVTGWSNQELADLYRTQRILAQAGVTTEVDRGITDEDDPWFVFMDSQGEVLVHFSRFDGTYLVSSPLQEAPIKGESLQDLVTQFSNRVQPVNSPGQTAPNVVSMGRRNRDVIFIHPAAALAALVWSVYLMSDELIAATPMIAAGEAEGSDPAPIEKAVVGTLKNKAEASDALSAGAQKTQIITSDQEPAKQGMAATSNRDGLAFGLSGHGAKAVGVSLSLVALAVGLPLPASTALEIIDDSEASQKLSLESLSAALAQVKAKEKAILLASEAPELEQREIDAIAQPEEKETAAALTIDPDTEAAAVVQLAEPTPTADTNALSAHTPMEAANITPRSEAPAQADEAAEEVAEVAEEEAPSPSVSALTASTKEVSFLQSFDAAFRSFEIASLDKIAQVELAELLSVETAIVETVIESPDPLLPAEETLQFEAFDQEARVYLDFLLQTYSNVKVLNLPTEIIFIHMDAFEGAGNTADIYAKSWSFDDGGTISTIGLKSDMIEFDLIA